MQRISSIFTLAAVAGGLAIPAQEAHACGGFFCSQEPIDQSGESILFAVDEEAGTVSTHVQISYEGAAEDFAWIVPVPDIPDLFLSTDQLFGQLDARLSAQFWLDWQYPGECDFDDMVFNAAEDLASTTATVGGVTVIATEVVGPYDTVILSASSSDELLTWLQDHDFDLPNSLDPVLAPYVDSNAYFVALRLSNNRDVGDLAPLGMTYEAGQAMIPIQLTSIAATEDMRLEVYVVGAERAVPENYLHVKINQAAIDWWNFGSNYEDVITLAADEAGGHAFATDYSGSTVPMHDVLHWEGRYDLSVFDGVTDPVLFMDLIMTQFSASQDLLSLLRTHIPMPQDVIDQGVDETSFYNCLECYAEYLDVASFDGPAFAEDLNTFLVEPLAGANEMLKAHPKISKLTSSISPIEMTLDPAFVFNPDMGDVSNVYEATLVTECTEDLDYDEAPRRLELPDGRVILLPSLEWMEAHDLTDFEFIQELTTVNAAVIERTGASGQPEVITDHTGSLDAQTNAFNDRVRMLLDGGACGGCSTTSPTPGLGWFGLLTLVFLRRRSRT